MKDNRRDFIKKSASLAAALTIGGKVQLHLLMPVMLQSKLLKNTLK